MATAYSTLLGLALPVTGELSGTWGDTVNNSITSLIESAIAGTTTLSTDADVTLSNLDGTADTSRQAILLWTAGGTVTRTVIAPALSKIYTVINASSSTQSIKVTGPGPTTGVTIIKGEAAMIAWNGSDFVKVSNTGGSFTTQDLTVTGNTILGDAITDTTTLNAQTRFQSRAILGYANMTGPAGVGSLSTTAPAFLYSGATTYTVSDTSGGTQAFAPVISLDQATITNATTTTIYTNAATLYIAGAPNRTGLVTFTNSYALYVAAGASYLGGTLNATGVATFSAGTAAAPAITSTGDTNTGIWFPAADTIAFTEGGVEAARFDSSGNLLVGNTTSYAGKFQSWGAVTANAATPNLVAIDTTSMVSGVGGELAFIGQYQVGDYAYFGSIRGIKENGTSGNTACALTFFTRPTATAPVERMRIDSSGNVGIGTSSPSTKLTVYDATSPQVTFNNGTSTFIVGNSAGGNNHILYGTGAYPMIFYTNATEVARIDSSGNLGIGNTSMTSFYSGGRQLVVGSGSGSQGMSIYAGPASESGIYFAKGLTGNDPFQGQLVYNHSLNAMRFYTSATLQATIDSSGNLLVGATSASGIITTSTSVASQAGSIYTRNTSASAAAYSGLTVGNDGAINRAGFILASSSATTSGFLAANSVYAYAGTGQFAMLTESAQPILFGTNNTERMRLDSSGNLGIGTTSPVTRLSVNTATQNSEAATIGGVDYGGTKRGLSIRTFQSAGGDDCGVEFNAAPSNSGYGAFKFTASSTNLMTLDASGRLLVGATSIPFSSNNTGVISWSVATGSGGEGGFAFVNTSTSTSSDQNPALVISKGSSTYTSSQRFIQFYANGTSLQAMGGIVGNGATNVQFISLSDAREKDNIQAITGSLNKITALNPVEFDWKKTGEHINAGFIAQEVELVFPEYVVDNVANAGEEERKGLTGGMSAGFIAHLVKAIQEQQALITTLAARITALEGA